MYVDLYDVWKIYDICQCVYTVKMYTEWPEGVPYYVHHLKWAEITTVSQNNSP